MRLHSLTVTAFGPFAGTVELDVDALHDAGLFLLSGPTGAGKTTLLDAVVFALYGAVPGARRAAGHLRSDHADAGAAPEVVLELTVRGRRLRVRRRAAWDRPKRRGTGTVREQARVSVEELGCDGPQVLSTRLDEAGHLLRELVGMTQDQFCQVVLLPQGEFARFLRADADERRAILQTLFGTGRFAAVEAWLAERRRATARLVEELQGELEVSLGRVDQAAGDAARHGAAVADDAPPAAGPDDTAGAAGSHDPADTADTADTAGAGGPGDGAGADGADPAAGAPDPLTAAQDRVRRLSAAARAQADAAVVELRAARDREAAARAQAGDAAQLAADTADAQELERRRGALAAAAVERPRWTAERAAALRAAPVAGLLPVAAAAERAASTAGRARDAVRRELPGPLRGQPSPALGDLLAATRGELAVLEQLMAETAPTRWASDLARLTSTVAAERAAVDAAGLRRDALPQRRALLAAALDAAAAAAAEEPALERELAAARAARSAADEAAVLATQLTAAATRAQDLRGRGLDAKEAWLAARSRRLDAMAAELAAGLLPGDPCPVCGSAEHPAPALGGADAAVDEERARRSADAAEARAAAAAEQEAGLRARAAAAAARAGDDPAVLAARCTGLEARWVASRTAREEAARSRAALDALAEEERSTSAEVLRATGALAGLEAELAALGRERAAAEERRTAARGEDPDVEQRHARLGDLVHRVERVLDAERQAEATAARAAAAREEAEQAATAAGFPDAAAAAAASLPPAELAALETRLQALDREEAALAERLAEPRFSGGRLEALLGGDPEAPARELAAATEELARAAAALEGAVAAQGLASRRAVELEGLVLEVDDRVERLRPAQSDAVLAERLSRLVEGAGGDNALRMRLSAYVLAARLEQVAEAATERLQRMSSGRYSLVHSDGAGAGRGRAGLGLQVVDAWTGVARDPGTLSGGEAFTASLALALGLSDVVTAEAGGAVIETLFVDEGFGSLDEDTLDEVLDVLDGLREGGRAVGVVSHVAELRARVPVQVLVDKGRQGSSVSVTGLVPRGPGAAPAGDRASAGAAGSRTAA
ncbi:exonuclease SbcC [Motilibacter rhizosphaerae]|uniref:Nuclease SbcCD subunit C n=1 Tax=Motilibacter rhizosphaerae TaxID=598652 RepID=A0A4Q7NC61_9ACTN|nr:AAA family ATPase [Motilibacter rhizosphaerae]RZS80197.1 exonuclease SbcC [Motilibacter rhizosphaerae]